MTDKTDPTHEEFEEFTLSRSGQAPLSFDGVRLTMSDGEGIYDPRDYRHYEVAIFQTRAGVLLASICFRPHRDTGTAAKITKRETPQDWVLIADSPKDLVSKLSSFDPLAPLSGWPPGYEKEDEQMRRRIKRSWDVQVSQALAHKLFAERIA